MKTALRGIQYVLCVVAVLSLGYCAFTVTESRMFQSRENAELERMRTQFPGRGLPAGAYPGMLGRVEIPRLDVSVVVVEGDSPAILSHAAGHIPGTSLPGAPGNVGISAHRDTFFRPLRHIRRDDLITVTTPLGSYRYRVLSTRIVPPSDVSVLKAGAGEILTLVTCYPFYFVGSAPDRFIVRAERVL